MTSDYRCRMCHVPALIGPGAQNRQEGFVFKYDVLSRVLPTERAWLLKHKPIAPS